MPKQKTEPDIEITRPPRTFDGRVPKPSALIVLQIAGILGLVAGGLLLLLVAVTHPDPGWKKIYVFVAGFGIIIAPFALLASYRRPPGMVAGMVALSFLMVAFPFGTIVAAIVGFLAIKNRDHVRDYYGGGVR